MNRRWLTLLLACIISLSLTIFAVNAIYIPDCPPQEPAPGESFTDGSDDTAPYQDQNVVTYLLKPTNGSQHVLLTFNYFETEEDWDFVWVYDGPNMTYPIVTLASGFRTPSPVISTGSSLFLRWRSDTATHFNGWSAVFYNTNDTALQCLNNTITLLPVNASLSLDTSSSASIRSHSGPGSYVSNLACYWRFIFDSSITTDTDPLIMNTPVTISPTFELNLTLFDTAPGDYLRVYDNAAILTDPQALHAIAGSDHWIMPLYTLHGTQTGRRLIVASRNLIFVWRTTPTEVGLGWSVQVDFYLSPYPPSPGVICPTDVTGSVCSGHGTCRYNDNDATKLPAECVCDTGYFGPSCGSVDCGGVKRLTAISGVITDHANDGGLYKNFAYCMWVLSAPSPLAGNSSLQLTISFIRMDTEALVDMLTIYAGPVPFPSTDLRNRSRTALSGSGLPVPIIMYQPPSSQATISFLSDASFTRPGFSLKYQWSLVDDQRCSPSPTCSSQGRCVNGACLCYPKYTGADCSIRQPNHVWVNPSPYGDAPPPLRGMSLAVPIIPGLAGSQVVYVFGGALLSGIYSSATYAFSIITGSWRLLTFPGKSVANGTLPEGRWYTVFQPLRDTKLILYGGETTSYDLSDMWILDTLDETWTRVITTPTVVRSVATSCVMHGHLLVVHGKDHAEFIQDTVYKLTIGIYTASTDSYNATWTLLGRTGTNPNPRQGASLSCFSGGRAILYGGTIGSNVQFDLWLYDYHTNSWAQTAPSGEFPIARWFHAAPVRNGNEAFIVTGFNDTWETEDIWSLTLTASSSANSDVTTSSTTSITAGLSLTLRKLIVPGVSYSPRSGSAAVIVGQSVVVFGGGTAKCRYADAWIYNDELSAANMTNDLQLITDGSSSGGGSNSTMDHFVGTAGDTLTLSLQVYDSYGNAKRTGGDTIIVYTYLFVSSVQTSYTYGTVVDNRDGTYSLSLSVTLSGQLPLYVTMNGAAIGSSPYNMTINAGAVYATKCFGSGSGLTSGTLLTPQTFFITSYDRFGNGRTSGDDIFIVELINLDDMSNTSLTVEYVSGNMYQVTFIPMTARVIVAITHDGQNIVGSPFRPVYRDALALSEGVFWFFTVMSIIICATSLLAAAAVYYYRKTPIIRAASPLFCYLLLAGICLCVIAVPLYGETKRTHTYDSDGGDSVDTSLCRFIPWLFGISFTLIFANLFAKTWRLHRVFNNELLRVRALPNSLLLKMISIILLAEVVINIGWVGSDPLRHELSVVGDSANDVSWSCQSNSFSFWMAIYLILKVGLLGWGVYLAIRTRNIPGAFNESKIIGFIIYNFSFIAILVLPSVVFITDITVSYSLFATGMLYCMACVLFGLFGYKLWICRFHPELNTTMPTNGAGGGGSNNSHSGPMSSGKSSGDKAVLSSDGTALVGEEIVVALDGKLPRATAELIRINANKIFRAVADSDLQTLRESARILSQTIALLRQENEPSRTGSKHVTVHSHAQLGAAPLSPSSAPTSPLSTPRNNGATTGGGGGAKLLGNHGDSSSSSSSNAASLQSITLSSTDDDKDSGAPRSEVGRIGTIVETDEQRLSRGASIAGATPLVASPSPAIDIDSAATAAPISPTAAAAAGNGNGGGHRRGASGQLKPALPKLENKRSVREAANRSRISFGQDGMLPTTASMELMATTSSTTVAASVPAPSSLPSS